MKVISNYFRGISLKLVLSCHKHQLTSFLPNQRREGCLKVWNLTAKANFQIFRVLITLLTREFFFTKNVLLILYEFMDTLWSFPVVACFLARNPCGSLFPIRCPWNWSKSNKNLIKASFHQTRNSEILKTVAILIWIQICLKKWRKVESIQLELKSYWDKDI